MKQFAFIGICMMLSSQGLADNDVWNQKAHFGGSARHRCTSFSIGTKGYLGLGHINAVSNVEYEDFWEYDPATNTWTQKANFGGGLRYHAVGFSVGNKGYVGMGREDDGDYQNDLWEFDPISNTWLQKSNCPGGDRRGSVAFVINNIAYVGSGEVQGGAVSNEFYAYDAALDSWYPIADFPGMERTSAVAFSIGSKGYFGTGGLAFGSTDFWEYDPAMNQWTQLADVGTIPRMEACGFAVNGKGYIGTGDDFSSGTSYADFWEYDVAADTWTQIDDFPGISRRYMTAFVIGNKAYAGVGTNGTNFKDWWEFDKTLAVIETVETDFGIYPNPVTDLFTITAKSQGVSNAQFYLFNQAGSLVMTASLKESTTVVSRNQLPASTYYYLIKKEYTPIQTGTLIFQ